MVKKPFGRPKGRKNDKTLAREVRAREVAEQIQRALGEEVFEGDAHALLQIVYKNPMIELAMRIDAAKSAAPFEKPKLQSIEAHITGKLTHEGALKDLADG